VDEYKLEKVYRPVEYTEYETCLDVTKGFRCPVLKKGGRYGYENKLVKVEKYVKACCEGYYQTKDNVCKRSVLPGNRSLDLIERTSPQKEVFFPRGLATDSRHTMSFTIVNRGAGQPALLDCGDRHVRESANVTMGRTVIRKQVLASVVQGPTCEDRCALGFFGKNCSKLCDCLNNNKCDSVTGKCLCVGWMGEKCERGCPRGFYGPMCSKKCELCNGISWTDSNAACDPVTGACKCERGYKGPDCKQRDQERIVNTVVKMANGVKIAPTNALAQTVIKCPEGKWGVECANECPPCVNGAKCNHVDGTCSCPAGYEGRLCNRLCVAGFWGLGCARNCSCASEFKQCDPHTGECACPAAVDEYEVPYVNGVRSPEARVRENAINAQRAGNHYT
ncbi:EGF-like domain protein, partial [Teladorsagia circumcincta]